MFLADDTETPMQEKYINDNMVLVCSRSAYLKDRHAGLCEVTVDGDFTGVGIDVEEERSRCAGHNTVGDRMLAGGNTCNQWGKTFFLKKINIKDRVERPKVDLNFFYSDN